MRWWGLMAVVAAAGCGGGANVMPLETGRKWEYTITNGMTLDQKFRGQLQVTRAVPVGSVPGVELQSALGTSRMAWDGGTLLASRLANCTFSPPIPLWSNDANTTWSGYLATHGRTQQATAELVREKGTVDLRTPRGDQKAYKSTLTVRGAGRAVVVETWFQRGVGILRQEQRINGRLALSMALQP